MADKRVNPADPNVQRLRADLTAGADHDRVVEAANGLIDLVNDRLNALDLNIASSLLARALIARGIRAVAAAWAADITGVPEPLTFGIMSSLADDPPAEIDAVCWIDPTIAGRS